MTVPLYHFPDLISLQSAPLKAVSLRLGPGHLIRLVTNQGHEPPSRCGGECGRFATPPGEGNGRLHLRKFDILKKYGELFFEALRIA